MSDNAGHSDAALPKHLAIIMDGNGRWAKSKGLERGEGHRAGASNVITLAEACRDRGIGHLSLFAFSTENWRRPKSEVDTLFKIASDYFSSGFSKFPSMGIKLNVIGDRKGLPPALNIMIDRAHMSNPMHHKMILNMAVNYGGRWDIAQAASSLAKKCVDGSMPVSEVDENSLEAEMSTAGQPAVDLLIRTGGERRISNFLIWQSAYAELYFSDKYWPDFGAEALDEALRDFAGRSRRFGGL